MRSSRRTPAQARPSSRRPVATGSARRSPSPGPARGAAGDAVGAGASGRRRRRPVAARRPASSRIRPGCASTVLGARGGARRRRRCAVERRRTAASRRATPPHAARPAAPAECTRPGHRSRACIPDGCYGAVPGEQLRHHYVGRHRCRGRGAATSWACSPRSVQRRHLVHRVRRSGRSGGRSRSPIERVHRASAPRSARCTSDGILDRAIEFSLPALAVRHAARVRGVQRAAQQGGDGARRAGDLGRPGGRRRGLLANLNGYMQERGSSWTGPPPRCWWRARGAAAGWTRPKRRRPTSSGRSAMCSPSCTTVFVAAAVRPDQLGPRPAERGLVRSGPQPGARRRAARQRRPAPRAHARRRLRRARPTSTTSLRRRGSAAPSSRWSRAGSSPWS